MGLIGLSGCESSPIYNKNGMLGFWPADPKWQASGFTGDQGLYLEKHGLDNPFEGKEWMDAGVSDPAKIIQWREAGFSPELAQKFIKAGVTDVPEAFSWADTLEARSSPEELNDGTIKAYVDAASTGEVTKANIYDVLHSGNLPRENSSYVIAIAKKVKSGNSVEQAISNVKKDQTDQYTSDFIHRYGKDIYDKCGTNIYPVAAGFGPIDPYAVSGKCFTIGIIPYDRDIQWLGENELLLTTYPLLILGDEHIRIGHDFIVVGERPRPYESVSGARMIPATFRVLKYLN